MLERIIGAVMMLSAVLTLTMLAPGFPPAEAGRAFFEMLAADGVAPLLFEHWRIVIGASAGLLIAGALHLKLRAPALILSGLSKLGFIALVLRYGEMGSLGPVVAVDAVMAALFALFLIASLRRR